MANKKIKIAFAEDIEDHRKRICDVVKEIPSFELIIKANCGRDLILKLSQCNKNLPDIILMDMQMPNCDGLLCTIICKWLFPTIKIVGLSSHTDGIVVGEFYAEGGNAFLSKLILNTAIAQKVYDNKNIFETVIKHIVKTDEVFNDLLLDDNGDKFKGRPSTINLIESNCQHLTNIQIKYLQLNAAGFDRKEIAMLLNMSIPNLKKLITGLLKQHNTKTNRDLISLSINLGIAKFVHIFQPATLPIF